MKTTTILATILAVFALSAAQPYRANGLDKPEKGININGLLNGSESVMGDPNKSPFSTSGNPLGLPAAELLKRGDLQDNVLADRKEENIGDEKDIDDVDDEEIFEAVVKDTDPALKKNPGEASAKDLDKARKEFNEAEVKLDEEIHKLDKKFGGASEVVN